MKEFSCEERQRLGGAGLRMFFNLAKTWELTPQQQRVLLGIQSQKKLIDWQKKSAAREQLQLKNETLERLSLIAGIQIRIELYFPKDRWASYVHASNSALGGLSLIELALQGDLESLVQARQLMDRAF